MSTFYPFNLKLGSPNNPVGFNPASVKDANGNQLLAQWGFGRGTTGNDEIYDKANNGDIRALQQGRCYTFDGTDDYIDCNDPIIDTATDLSFSLWFKTTNINSRFMSIKRSGASDDLVRAGVNSGGGAFLEFDDGTVTGVGVGSANDGEWHHIAFTYDADGGADNMKLYFDGVLRNTDTVANFDFSNTDGNLICGIRYNLTNNAYGGEMWDYRVFVDHVLTADEVAYMASLGKVGTEPPAGTLWYKMDEQAGTTAYNSNGNTNAGTITNATLGTFHGTQDIYSYQNQVGYSDGGSGVFVPRDESNPTHDALGNTLQYTGVAPQNPKLIDSNCCTGDGADDYIEIPDATAFDISDNLTVGLWAKNDNAALGSNEFLIGRYDSGVSKREWNIGVDSNEKIIVNFGDPADGTFEGTLTSDDAVAIDSWHHYAFTFNGGTVKIYLDGVEVPYSITSGAVPSSLYASDIETTILAILASGSVNGPWDGNICDVRIYSGGSAPLTDADVLDWYQNGTKDFTDQTLAARYKLTEGAGETAFDSSGNGNHGTLTNFTLANAWGTVQDNFHGNILEGCSKRMYFDGTDDYVEVADTDDLSFGDGAGNDEPFSVGLKVVSSELNAGDAVTKANADASIREYRVILSDGSGNTNFIFYDGTNNAVTLGIEVVGGVASLEDGNVHDVVCTYDGSKSISGMKIYFDGVEQTVVDISAGSYPGMSNTAGPFYIGKVTTLYQKGSLFDVKVFSDELTAVEAADYLSVTDNVISHWKGYGNTDADWEDQAGSNDGTVSGSPTLLRIPSDDSDPSLDAAGSTLTNPSGNWHNGAETDINFNPATTPEMANIYTNAEGDGSADYVVINNNALFDITDNLTVSCWAKNDSASVATEYIITKYDFGADEREWALTFFGSSKLAVNFGDPADGTFEGRWESDDAISAPNQWHHYAFTFDGGTVQLYVDGLPISGSTASGSIPSTLYNGTAPFTVFTELDSGVVANPWDGNIQQVRIYSGSSAALTDAQMLDVSNNPEKNLAFSGQTLIAAYDLLGDTLDSSGNNLHGRNVGVTMNKYTVPTDYSFGDSLGTQYNHFKREVSSAQEDRYLLYRESLLHNSKLSKVENYTT